MRYFFTDKRLSIGVEDWSAPAYCWKLLSCEILFAHYLFVFLMKKFNNINKMVSFYLSQLPKAVTSGIFHSVDLVSKWLFCFIENFIGYFGLDSKAINFTEKWQHQHKMLAQSAICALRQKKFDLAIFTKFSA